MIQRCRENDEGMTENSVKQVASTAASAASAFVRGWTHALHAVNDNEEPDPPPAMAARLPLSLPFTAVKPRVEAAAA